MFKLYRKHIYDPQIRWIREHPMQYIALNATLLAAFWIYIEYEDRKFERELEDARTQHEI